MKTSEKLYEIEYTIETSGFTVIDIQVRNGAIRVELHYAPSIGLMDKLEEFGEVEYLGNGITVIQ